MASKTSLPVFMVVAAFSAFSANLVRDSTSGSELSIMVMGVDAGRARFFTVDVLRGQQCEGWGALGRVKRHARHDVHRVWGQVHEPLVFHGLAVLSLRV